MSVQSKVELVELKIIRRGMRHDDPARVGSIYLPHLNGEPVVLGTGRFAKVWLASEGNQWQGTRSRLLAIKLVRRDKDSEVVNAAARWRFFEEMLKTSRYGSATPHGEALIDYIGYGRFKADKSWDELRKKRSDVYVTSEYQFFERLSGEKEPERESATVSHASQVDEDVVSALGEDTRKRSGRHDVDELMQCNRQELQQAKVALDDLQGEFYVMTAALGTLEDFLMQRRDWQSSAIYSLDSSAPKQDLDEFRKRREALLHRFAVQHFDVSKVAVSEGRDLDLSGFSILSCIRSRQLRNRVVLELAGKMASAVRALHAEIGLGEEGNLCHRDLKPGNFLVMPGIPSFRLSISDLGFVGGVTSVISGRATGQLNSREAFVLPPGTFPFRAPEQVQPVFEVSCKLLKLKNCDEETLTVELQTFTKVEIEVGDWLESSDLRFGSDGTQRARIESIVRSEDGPEASRYVVCGLSSPVRPAHGVSDPRGSVIRAVAQHSDLFSLGSLIYFLITGGKNPEQFWARCLALMERAPSEEKEEGLSFFTCASLALALCNDGGDHFKKDAQELKLKGGGSPLARLIPDAITMLRRSPNVKPLLEDVCGERICLPIMLLITRCMLRGWQDSFVTPTSSAEAALSMAQWDLSGKAGDCADWCSHFVNMPSCKVVLDEWKLLGNSADEILFSLRVGLTGEILKKASQDQARASKDAQGISDSSWIQP